jgi:hypothetical protein
MLRRPVRVLRLRWAELLEVTKGRRKTHTGNAPASLCMDVRKNVGLTKTEEGDNCRFREPQ